MILYEQALTLLKGVAPSHPPAVETVDLAHAVGRIAAGARLSPEAAPPFDNSAMDGFALRASDTNGASASSPLELEVVSTLAAGDAAAVSEPHRRAAVEIMTGAPLPTWTDAVVKLEEVSSLDSPRRIRLTREVAAKENVRFRGEDFAQGDAVVESGTRIAPRHVLALATLGIARLDVRRAVEIVIIPTGRELVPHDAATLPKASIRNSTRPFLEAALTRFGARVRSFPIVGDDAGEVAAAIRRALDEHADLIITTGAVSVGKFDVVQPALHRLDARVHFHRVAIRPGKPLLFAELGSTVLFGLPGNPLATVVGTRFFVEPYLRVARGESAETPIRARLKAAARKPSGLRCFFKAALEVSPNGAEVTVLPGQASFMVRPLLHANAWAVLPESGDTVDAGTVVDVFPLQGDA
nr:molybdopterin molybdenumtransferase MoeA [uncultured bacterium]